jgi:uncharacterized protein (TIGR02391 family)
MSSIASLIPHAEDLLGLEPEELAGFVLQHLHAIADRAPGQLNRHNYTHPASANVQAYPPQFQSAVAEALTEAWVWLEREGLIAPQPDQTMGDWVFLTRRGKRLTTAAALVDYRKQQQLPRYYLHPRINQRVWPDYLRERYDSAIFLAFKEVEVAVRAAAKLDADLIGVKLMQRAFQPGTGPLTDTVVPHAEQVATMNLFCGAIGLYKNPHSHRDVAITDPVEAIAPLLLVSHLLRLVERRSPAE